MTRRTLESDTTLSRYLAKISTYPLLTPEEEVALGQRIRSANDEQAQHTLVNAHLRLVAEIAFGYSGYGMPVKDLIAEGTIGALQAAKRFDPDRGFRFATYARWWIRAAIQEYILHNSSIVKFGTTAAQKTLFFNLNRTKKIVGALEEKDLSPEQVSRIAQLLRVEECEVISMNGRMQSTASLHDRFVPFPDAPTFEDMLVDESASPEDTVATAEEFKLRSELLSRALATLNPREQHIIRERRLRDNPTTLEDLSCIYNISRERVRQIEVRAFTKLQNAMLGIQVKSGRGKARRTQLPVSAELHA